MITLFAVPKPFAGKTRVMQINAIRSWMLLRPKPEIILLGDEEGVAEIACNFGLKHIPEIERNEYGTPIVSSVFQGGQAAASFPIVCYLNADIILMSDFGRLVARLADLMVDQRFLLIGGRWNVDLFSLIDFEDPRWAAKLRSHTEITGWQDTNIAMDYFVFPKDIQWDIPEFALGRGYWDSWFVYKARAMGIPVIDGSKMITAIHPNHHYSHIKSFQARLDKKLALPQLTSPESSRNLAFLGLSRRYLIPDATHMLTPTGLQKQVAWRRYCAPRLMRFEFGLNHFLGRFHPISYPLYLLLKSGKYCMTLLVRLLARRISKSQVRRRKVVKSL